MLLCSPRSALGLESALFCPEVTTRGGTGGKPRWTCYLCSALNLQLPGFMRAWAWPLLRAQGGVSVSDGGG